MLVIDHTSLSLFLSLSLSLTRTHIHTLSSMYFLHKLCSDNPYSCQENYWFRIRDEWWLCLIYCDSRCVSFLLRKTTTCLFQSWYIQESITRTLFILGFAPLPKIMVDHGVKGQPSMISNKLC